MYVTGAGRLREWLNGLNGRLRELVGCVEVVSVSFRPRGASTKRRARKKGTGWGGAGKERKQFRFSPSSPSSSFFLFLPRASFLLAPMAQKKPETTATQARELSVVKHDSSKKKLITYVEQ